ncbi:MAG: aminotransferase class I/II-fold pyridoxal phosphate-dependent enzyme, partial [Halomonadaceae bacterium]
MGTQGLNTGFDQVFSREGTNAEKYDGRQRVFGRQSVIPLWLADTDFAAPRAITEALEQRARHPSYGYSQYPESLYQALIGWYQQQHHWAISRDQILLCPGVVASLEIAVGAFTKAGQGVIIQPPVYPPFASVVEKTGRRLITNPLTFDGNHYQMDLDHLDACASQPDTHLLLLCSPHNPVGRVWQRQELEQVLAIARRHNLVVLADEVHGDLIYPDRPGHRALATLTHIEDALVTAVSPGKSFNIQGMGLSALVS